MKLIVGLGNPGVTYVETRHNVGFMVLDALRTYLGTDDWRYEKKFDAEISIDKDRNIALMKPQTFMNLSGNAVGAFVKFYKLNPTVDLLVIYDDIDVAFGDVKLREKGSSAGQKGCVSIIESLGTQDFFRIKFGIGRQEKHIPTDAFVLQKFTPQEKTELTALITTAVQKTVDWLK